MVLSAVVVAVVALGVAMGSDRRSDTRDAPAGTRSAGVGEEADPVAARRPRCDRVLGRRADVADFVDSLRAGKTGCLRRGVHRATDVVSIDAPKVTLTSRSVRPATIVGRVSVAAEADGARIENLKLDGRNELGKPSPTINANKVILRGNDITNRHTTICVSITDFSGEPPPRGVVIADNVIHDCGELPATNHHHGIYVSHARGTVIRNNVIYGNADRGVQLYPDADDSIVTGNVIDGNGQGVIFGGGPDSSSDDNLVAGNVITGSNIRWNIQSHWQGPVGSGNVARDNCVWTTNVEYPGLPPGSGIEPEMVGTRAFDNVVADPVGPRRGCAAAAKAGTALRSPSP